MNFLDFLEQVSRAPDAKNAVDRLEVILRRVVCFGKSPSKLLTRCKAVISSFVAKERIQAHIDDAGGRGIECRIFIPERFSAGVSYNFAIGYINTRTKTVEFKRLRPISFSLHALDRLCERLSAEREEAIIEEIQSCFEYVIPWGIGAEESGAVCWPLLTSNGFFVARKDIEVNQTIAVTWLSNGRLTKKWKLVERDLRNTSVNKPDLALDLDFAKMFLTTFPWMLLENITDEDHYLIESEQSEVVLNNVHKDDIENDLDLDLDVIGQKKITPLRPSYKYRSGVNYCDQLPQLKIYSVHWATVIRRTNYALVVVLESGLVGRIQVNTEEDGTKLIEKYIQPDIGEKIEVVIKKILKVEGEGYFVIYLQENRVSVALWSKVMEACPIGSHQEVEVKFRKGKSYFGETKNGFPCQLLPEDASIISSKSELFDLELPLFGVKAVVVEYNFNLRALVVSITESLGNNDFRARGNYSEGENLIGMTERVSLGNFIVRLGPGSYGKCVAFNSWNRQFPKVGAECEVVLIDFDDANNVWNVGLPKPETATVSNYVRSQWFRKDEYCYNNFAVGMVLGVQVLCWMSKAGVFIVACKDGFPLWLPASEVTWGRSNNVIVQKLLQPGSIISVKVIDIDEKKKRVIVSKRDLEFDFYVSLQNSLLAGCRRFYGEVVNVMDYGYFVRFHNSTIEGLLHRSKVPEGVVLNLGQEITFQLDAVDVEKHRVSLRIDH